MLSGMEILSAAFYILLGEGSVRTTMYLIRSVSPAIQEAVRRFEIRIDLTALHILELTIRTTEGKVGITEVGIEDTIEGRQADGHFLTLVLGFSEVHTDGSPFLPEDIRITAFYRSLRLLMPSLGNSRGCEFSVLSHGVGIKVRHTASSDRLAVDEHIKHETGVLVIIVRRRLQDRHILKQEDRILDRIYIKGELNPLCELIIIPVTETHGSQFAVGNGLRRKFCARLVFRTIEMHGVETLNFGRSIVHALQRKVRIGLSTWMSAGRCDITLGIIKIQIIHAELIGIIDQFTQDSLEAIVVFIAFSADDEVRLTDLQIRESGTGTLYDLRSRPSLFVIRIGANLIFRRGSGPRNHDGSTVLGNLQVRRCGTGFIIGNIDIIDHSTGLLRVRRTVGPCENEIVGRTIALITFNRSSALTPGNRSVQIIDIRARLQRNDIVLVGRRNRSTLGRNRIYLNRGNTILLVLRNPEEVETVKIAGYVRHHRIVKEDGIIARSERIQGDSIIGENPATGSLVLRRGTVVVGNIETIVTVSVIITRLADIPLIPDLSRDSRIRRRVKYPSIPIRLRLEIARIVCNSMDRSRQGKGSYHQDTN